MPKEFTLEEIEILRKNLNTWAVNKTRISLTKEAKEHIVELAASGKSARQCIEELGYNPDMLGKSRFSSMLYNAQREVRQGKQLHNGYAKRKPKRITVDELEELSMDPESFGRMKNELAYLRQEVDFLKKISQLAKSKKRGD